MFLEYASGYSLQNRFEKVGADCHFFTDDAAQGHIVEGIVEVVCGCRIGHTRPCSHVDKVIASDDCLFREAAVKGVLTLVDEVDSGFALNDRLTKGGYGGFNARFAFGTAKKLNHTEYAGALGGSGNGEAYDGADGTKAEAGFGEKRFKRIFEG